ncbi:hypothetical protein CYY_007080 [Polysphondylium violaceum]|uniref:Ankyrin repeat-containing protein n=1 Tax=Polysphondylium violaceum TaxID=133409 RepID=A0A8J4V577_9MYCE|nr:hypothetical protein CYY_007080 [Polysphondylium violaceum]
MNHQSLFKDIISNKYISNRIFQFVQQQRGKRYNEIFRLDYISKHAYWSVLRDKLARGEFLYLDDTLLVFVFKIPDLELFIQIFSNRFKYYFKTISTSIPLSQYALKYNNVEIFKYLISIGYYPCIQSAFRYASENGNKELIIYMIDHLKEITSKETYKHHLPKTIVSIVIDIIEFKSNSNNSDADKNDLLLHFISAVSKIKIKFTVQEKIELIKYSLLLNDNVDLMNVLLKFSGGIVKNERIKVVPKWFHRECSRLAFFRIVTVSDHALIVLKENNFCISSGSSHKIEDFNSELDYDSLVRLMNRWRRLDPNAEFSIHTGIDSQIFLSSYKDWMMNGLDGVIKLLTRDGALITKECIFRLVNEMKNHKADLKRKESLWEIFLYVYQHYRFKGPSFFDALAEVGCEANSFDIINFIVEQRNSFSKHEWWIGFSGDDCNLLHIQKFIESFPLTLDHQGLVFGALKYSIKKGSDKIFNFLWSQFDKRMDLKQLYSHACLFNRVEILKILVKEKIPHDNKVFGKCQSIEMIDILLSAGHKITDSALMNREGFIPRVEVLKYIIDNMVTNSTSTQEAILLLMRECIEYHKIAQFKYLLSIYCNYTSSDSIEACFNLTTVLECIGRVGDVEALQTYIAQYPHHNEYYQYCWTSALVSRHITILDYLVSTIDHNYLFANIHQQISDAIDRVILKPQHIYILFYFRDLFQSEKITANKDDIIITKQKRKEILSLLEKNIKVLSS